MAIGITPTTGFQPVDNDWLNGISGGHNLSFKNGISAAGTNQATSTQLPDRVAVLEIDTSSSSQGVAMPPALAGVRVFVGNNTSNNVTVFPSIANNSATSAQDTFNAAATSYTLNANTGNTFTCGKNGVWFTD
jgi:hypothetical protein